MYVVHFSKSMKTICNVGTEVDRGKNLWRESNIHFATFDCKKDTKISVQYPSRDTVSALAPTLSFPFLPSYPFNN